MEFLLIMGGTFLLIGVLLLYFGFRERGVFADLRQHGLETSATVLAVDRKVAHEMDADSDADWLTTYQFTGTNGQTQTGSTKHQWTQRTMPQVGSLIAVVYLPDNPERNRVAVDVQSNFIASIIIGFGVVFGVIGFGTMVAAVVALVA